MTLRQAICCTSTRPQNCMVNSNEGILRLYRTYAHYSSKKRDVTVQLISATLKKYKQGD